MNRPTTTFLKTLFLLTAALVVGGCVNNNAVRPGTQLKRHGDEIVVAGQYFRTGAPVVLWTDPGGYDAYRTERRFVPWERASYEATTQESKDIDTPQRYGLRSAVLTDEEIEQVRGGGWPLELLQQKVDQFVLHYDVCGTSAQCFKILHDMRGLSVQFMLDVDGTIYQTCDLKERAWHATIANSRSVGVEIAHMGAYRTVAGPLSQWYKKDDAGVVKLSIPEARRKLLHNPQYAGGPARQELVGGKIQGEQYVQYDFTPEQYDSLTKLIATLSTALPKIQVDYPRDANGKLIPHVLSPEEFKDFQGVLGHFHVQANKQDPGPAMDWEKIINGARAMMSREAITAMEAERGKPVQELRANQSARPRRNTTQPAAPTPVTQPAK